MPALPPLTGTVNLGEGEYTSNAVNIAAPGTKVIGIPGKTFLRIQQAPSGVGLGIKAGGVELRGLSFIGGGIFIDGGRHSGIIIDNNDFSRMNPSGQERSGIAFPVGLIDSRITNNLFGSGVVFGLWGTGQHTRLTVANNEFERCIAAMHIDANWQAGESVGCLFEQNLMHVRHGMGMEFQGNWVNTIVQDNWFYDPQLSNVFVQNNNSMSYSLIWSMGRNNIVRRNVAIAQPRGGDGLGVRIGLEIGGDNVLVEDCFFKGINHTIAMNDGDGTASVIVRNVRWEQVLQGATNTFPASHRTFKVENSGPNAQLSAEMERRLRENDRPKRNKRYGQGPIDPPPPPPPTGFTVTAVAQDIATTGTAKLNFTNLPANTISLQTFWRATKNHADKNAGVSQNLAPVQGVLASGAHPGWEIDIRVEALADDGAVLATTEWMTLPPKFKGTLGNPASFPGDPTISPWPRVVIEPPPPDPGPGDDAELLARIAALESERTALQSRISGGLVEIDRAKAKLQGQ